MKDRGFLINPFYINSLVTLAILIIFNFGWSDLYPTISVSTYIFFILSIIISGYIGYRFNKINIEISKNKNNKENIAKSKINIKVVTIFVLITFALDFFYEGHVPIIEILFKKSDFNYLGFRGIPSIHVLLVTFNSFFTIYILHRFLIEKNKTYIIYFLLNLLPALALFNRGMLAIIFVSCISIYIIEELNWFISFKTILIVSILGIIFLYFFGISGNLRSNKDYYIGNDYTDSTYILNVGEASEGFRDSIIPKSFFWGYLYSSSPLANLENTIQHNSIYQSINTDNVINFLVKSIVPDFIGNRILDKTNLSDKNANLITPALTVSTMYSESYLYLGALGMILLFTYWVLLILIYTKIMPKDSQYFAIGIAILNTMTIINFFDNMFVFTGLSFQLVYPMLFMLIFEKKILIKLKNKIYNVEKN